MPPEISSSAPSHSENAIIWEILEAAVALAQEERKANSLPIENFKIDRPLLLKYIANLAQQRGFDSIEEFAESKKISTQEFENSLIVLKDKIIAMDHVPGTGDYKERYVSFGSFGKVKAGIDKEGIIYAVKTQRTQLDASSQLELEIMKEIGVLIGEIHRDTKTPKLWLDQSPINQKTTLVMEWRPGTEIANYLDYKNKHYRNFTYPERMVIALGLIAAIKAINDKGIAHRDIKPQNILLDITQLPPNLTADNIEDYLNGKLAGFSFEKLVKEVDWGLALRINKDGSATDLSPMAQISVSHTAPECYVNQEISLHSEAYAVSNFITRYLNVFGKELNENCPDKLQTALSEYEKARAHLEELKSAQKKKVDKKEPLKQSEDVSQETAAGEALKEKALALKTLLAQYAPQKRHSLDELSNGVREMLMKSLQQKTKMQPNAPQAQDEFPEDSGYLPIGDAPTTPSRKP